MKPIIVAILFAIGCVFTQAQVRLPALVRDSMILQRDAAVKIWGWAAVGEKIHIKFNGKKYSASTGANGRWQVTMQPMKAGGPYTMTISASNQLLIKDILIGDVLALRRAVEHGSPDDFTQHPLRTGNCCG